MAGIGVQAGDIAETRSADLLLEAPRFDDRTAIEPDQGGRERAVRCVDGDDAVDLGRDGDPGNIGRADPGRGDDLPQGGTNREAPRACVLLSPARTGRREGIVLPRPGDDCAGGIDEEGLRALGPDIAADDEDGPSLPKSLVVIRLS
jgi:hypothetical protein